MREEKRKIDTSPERIPLTDNPFAQLAALKQADLPPAPAQPRATPAAKILPAFQVARTRKGGYNLAVERRAGGSGKVVTLLRGVEQGGAELLALLKKQCGAGGAFREDTIEIQGDHRERIERLLRELL